MYLTLRCPKYLTSNSIKFEMGGLTVQYNNVAIHVVRFKTWGFSILAITYDTCTLWYYTSLLHLLIYIYILVHVPLDGFIFTAANRT